MSAKAAVVVDHATGIVTLTLAWPDGLGCWHAPATAELEAALDRIEDGPLPRAVVVRSTGQPGAACRLPTIDECGKWEKLLVRLERLDCISVAVIDGPCVRVWMQVALACDFRVATHSAYLQVLELREGYLPGMNTFRLAKYLGIGRTRRLMFTAGRVSAREAVDLGLIDDLGDDADPSAAVDALLKQVSDVPVVTARLTRRLVNESFAMPVENFMGQYLASQNRCLSEASAKRGEP